MNPDNNHLIDGVVTAGVEDIESMLQLNDRIYPKEWHVAQHILRKLCLEIPRFIKFIKLPLG